jgi:hypothetical protein
MMAELVTAYLDVDGREGKRFYSVELHYKGGVRFNATVFENQFPEKAKKLQSIIDAVRNMSIAEKVMYIENHIYRV